jgi:thiol-disulfide isomerase/thioredoxin/plastocyanin/CHASE3 domain sensor protein
VQSKSRTTARRIAGAFGAVLLLFALALVVMIVALEMIGSAEREVARLDRAKHAGHHAAAMAREQYMHQAHTLLTWDGSHLEHYYEVAEQAKHAIHHLESEVAGHHGQDQAKEISRLILASDQRFRDEVWPAIQRGERSRMPELHMITERPVEEVVALNTKLNTALEAESDAARHEADEIRDQARIAVIACFALAIAAATAVGIFLLRSISRPVAALRSGAKRIGAGDLSALKIPAITYAVGGQLAMPAIVEVGASWSFGGGARRPAVHDHAHDVRDAPADVHVHEPLHPDVTGLDVVDLGKPGEQVALVPVAGKITIFDFWATWCEPCKVLEPALVEIARAHPEVIAIRRIDAVDWDSAVVAQYLTPRGFGLPHIKVFDRSGRLLLERSSEPGKLEVLIDDMRRLVDGGSAIEAKNPPPLKAPPARTSVVSIAVTSKGFDPNNVVVLAGKPVTLRFVRSVEKTCATEVVLDVDGKRIVKDLPLGKRVDLTLTFTQRGEVRYACAMDMIRGTITVR